MYVRNHDASHDAAYVYKKGTTTKLKYIFKLH